jgi:hypothetical protein
LKQQCHQAWPINTAQPPGGCCNRRGSTSSLA